MYLLYLACSTRGSFWREVIESGTQCAGAFRLVFLNSYRLFFVLTYLSSTLKKEMWVYYYVLTGHLEVVAHAEKDPKLLSAFSKKEPLSNSDGSDSLRQAWTEQVWPPVSAKHSLGC